MKKILIIGCSPCAVSSAENLLSKGYEVVFCLKNSASDLFLERVQRNEATATLENSQIASCKGFNGNFELMIISNGKKITQHVSSIIIAEESTRRPNFSFYTLKESDMVISLSMLKTKIEASDSTEAAKIVFLTGLTKESNSTMLAEIMNSALKLKIESDKKIYILTGNLKVAENGLEALYRKTRDAGVIYVKFGSTGPDIVQAEDGKVTIIFEDDISGKKFRLKPELTVVDETICPSENLAELAEIFRIEQDRDGFLQSDNVHCLNVLTNRKGIMVAGPSRGIFSPSENMEDAMSCAVTAIQLAEKSLPEPENRAEKTIDVCVGCLTCYRVCPYRVIQLDNGISIPAEACEGCGICAAECPGNRIQMKGPAGSIINDHIKNIDTHLNENEFTPLIIAFCCSRSAAKAADLSTKIEPFLIPSRLKIIELPCAGFISFDHILACFKSKANGVIVLTCHENNCHSQNGNIYAKARVDVMRERLAAIGIDKERLSINSISSNMGLRFSEITNNFANKIKTLGPTSNKK